MFPIISKEREELNFRYPAIKKELREILPELFCY
ncbi:hypothetical protein HBHAL_4380 [Halobacillus halophilus DSM 2266]|uniref:Uncharacterized protein n=1 Tax=Halobacillus halophilus (strain ATCC 35676 / DSM 2266 / JCM 20832 / KCTC 3685 / LMG 17431 / NBRC 102448 / NCIMB 2269) TaxID=866895 RepID=I0JRF0_HALH3|nr:hypothetical protein HBHAL_4380 [Halobacillus halophilus DSM 2266]